MVALFALGLMAKPMLVTLPFVLLLLDYWPLGRMSLRCASGRCRRRCTADFAVAILASGRREGSAAASGGRFLRGDAAGPGQGRCRR